MRAGLIAAAVAAWLTGGFAGTSGKTVDVRICSTLEEAAPPGGGPVLLVFFSTGCHACYDDLFESRFLVDKGEWPVSVVGVASALREDLQEFLEKHAWTLPVVLDRRRELFRRFGVDAIPYKALLLGKEAVYRDDPYLDPRDRREELKRCLIRLFSR